MTLTAWYRRWREECRAENTRYPYSSRIRGRVAIVILLLLVPGLMHHAKAQVHATRLSVTGWMKTGEREWKSYITDKQVSVITMKVVGKKVLVKVTQNCHDALDRVLEQKNTLTWRFGEREGTVIGCQSCSLSIMPRHLEWAILESDLPKEVEVHLSPFRKMRHV